MRKLGLTVLVAALSLPLLAKTPKKDSTAAKTQTQTTQTTKKHVKKIRHKKAKSQPAASGMKQ